MGRFFFKDFDISKALYRFWPSIFFAFLGSAIVIYSIEHNVDDVYPITKFVIFSWLAMLAFLNLQLAKEVFKISLPIISAISVLILAILTIYHFFYLPPHESLFSKPITYNFLGFGLALHLLISVLPYLGKGNIEDFWQYNKSVLILFLESLFNSLALFLGLLIAILALKFLFDLDIDFKVYGQLFALILGLFNTSYFLSRFPSSFYNLEVKKASKGYLIFSQFIAIPMVILYLTILYAYGIKIIVQQELPKGWVSNLVLWFSVIGILSYLLNYYLNKFEDNKLSAFYRKYFFYAIPIPLVLLFVAIWRRISDYGVTENRYIVAILAVWVAGISLYFIFSKKDNIKLIPISLALTIIFAIFSPFSLSMLSKQSQEKRLLALLSEHNLFNGSTINGFDEKTNNDLSRQISAQLRYLDKLDHLEFLNEFAPFSKDPILSKYERFKLYGEDYNKNTNASKVADKLNIIYKNSRYLSRNNRFNHHSREKNWSHDISNFDLAMSFSLNKNVEQNHQDNYVVLNKNLDQIKIYLNKEYVCSVELIPLIKELESGDTKFINLQREEMDIAFSCEQLSGELFIESIAGEIDSSKYAVDYISGKLFLKNN